MYNSMMATAVILFFSCSNDFENVIKVSEFEKLPELTGDNIHFTQTEYGKKVISIYTPKLIESKKDDESNAKQMEFPQGISVLQYSSYPDTLSLLTANYAINDEEKDIWEARGNVVAKNVKSHEELNTEYLVWDQKEGIIYSDKKVRVITPDDIIMGEGFSSDDQFTEWQVEKVTGIISFDSEEIGENNEEGEE